MVGRSGAPDAPSRPGDQGVERGPDDWEDFIGRSELRFIEVAIPGVTISSAAVAGAIPGCTGGGEAEAGEGEQRAGWSDRHSGACHRHFRCWNYTRGCLR